MEASLTLFEVALFEKEQCLYHSLILLGVRLGQEPRQPSPARVGLDRLSYQVELSPLGGLTDRRGDPVGPLMLPPVSLFLG
jgi:hypothetical protein